MDTENELKPDNQVCKFFELPHYVLRILLSYLDSTSLYLLSKTCSYLKEAVEDPALWKYVDARSKPNSNEKINYVTENIHEKTTHLLLQGYKKYTNIPQTFFAKIDPFENLRVLALENIKLYGSKVTLKDFPSCLEELSLKRSYVKNSAYFFQHSVKRMHNLRVLILDECSWVTCSVFLSVSKFENLEIISAVKCLRIHLNMVPYLNVAKYGCKKLKVLDFRFTGIGGELLRTFYSKHSIQHMYFQSYKSAQVDYDEKINSNIKMLSRSSVDVNTDLNITDNCLRDYTTSTADSFVQPITKSMLYKDPYPECECGYKNSDEERTMPGPTIYSLEDDNDVYGPPAHTTAKFVCQKHMKDVEKLPNDFKDFFVIHQKQFHSDITSDIDSDSDSSGGSDDPACCIYAMGTKMVILPNVHEPNNRSEMNLPCRDGSRDFAPLNIFIVNPFDARNNRQQNAASSGANNQPGPSGAGPSNSTSTTTVQNAVNTDNVEFSTVNKAGCEKRKHDDNDSESDDEATNKKRKVENNLESGGELVGSKESDKRESDAESDENKASKDKQGNKGFHQKRIKEISSKTNDGIGQQCENFESPGVKLEKDKIKSKCGSTIKPDRKKVSGNTARSNKYDSDSDSDTEKDKITTPKERHRRKGKRFSDSRAGPSGKEKCSKSGRSQVDTENLEVGPNEAVHSGRLNEANDGPAEQLRIYCEKVINDQRPSTSRANNTSAETAASNGREHAVANREPSVIDQVAGTARARPGGLSMQCVSPARLAMCQAHGRLLPKTKISLRRISLRGYRKVTHLALLYLRYLQIELIDLTYTSVTKQEIENFLLYNPNCRVIHPMYCVCKPRNPF